MAERRRHVLTLGAAWLLTHAPAQADEAPPAPPLATPAPASTAPATTARPSVANAPLVLWPTLTPAGDEASSFPVHRPGEVEQLVFARAQELDATLKDAAQDLGMAFEVGDTGPAAGHTRDIDVVARAARGPGGGEGGTWVVSPRIEYAGDNSFILRMVAVPPLGRELRVRVDQVRGPDISVRGLVMLRDLLSPATAAQAAAIERERDRVDTSAGHGVMGVMHSPGRAVLAVNGALFGAFVAYSVQKASGSDDPRVLYPLLALGTGVGIGSSLLAAEEWNVGSGEAWFVAGGAWWGAASGVFIANGRRDVPLTDRFAFGVGGGLGGLGLGIFALTRSKIDEGDAALLHSGGALGTALGTVGELFYRGSAMTDAASGTGAGYGAAIGLVGGGVLATFTQTSTSRVLLVDLGAGLGGVGGAALASPLVFEDVTPGKARGFLAATAAGTLIGGGVAFALTRNAERDRRGSAGMPVAGVIGGSATPEGVVPAYGAGWRGVW